MANDHEEKDTSSIPKIRTFAADLEAVRKSRGEETETDEEKELKPKPKKEAPKTEAAPVKKEPPKPEPKKEKEPEPKKDRPKPQIHRPKPSSGNPPFHEINKHKHIKVDVDKADVEASQSDDRKSLLEDTSKTVRISGKGKSGVDGGTVVTDTKRKRFRLIPSMFRSFIDWLEDLKNVYLTKKPPKYTVSGSYRTRGVITDETVSSGKFQVDHKEAVRRIKKRREAGEEVEDEGDEDTADKKQKHPLLLEAPDEEAGPQPRTNVVAEERKSAATKRQKELEEKEAELKKREEALKAAESKAAKLQEEARAAAQKSKEEAAAEAERLREEAEAAVTEAEARREAAANEVSDAQMRAAAAAILAQQGLAVEEEEGGAADSRPLKEQLRDTNVASLLAVVGIAGLVMLYVAGASLYSMFFAPEEIAPSVDVPTVVSGEQTQLLLTQNELQQQLMTTIDQAQSTVVQVNLIRRTDTGELDTASPEQIVAGLGWRAEPAFITSLRQIAIGGFERSYPFFILKTTDYETALGGMLNWENTLSEDLSLFRGTHTDGAPEAGEPFIDATVGGVDVRESTAAVENQVVWGFANDTTILIAPNRRVFTEVLPLVH